MEFFNRLLKETSKTIHCKNHELKATFFSKFALVVVDQNVIPKKHIFSLFSRKQSQKLKSF